ncbi:MAG: hypothetical protein JWO36_6564 [Myxococcales bacterium]|nr:hypothetical protein [Myxococcales bacterium]
MSDPNYAQEPKPSTSSEPVSASQQISAPAPKTSATKDSIPSAAEILQPSKPSLTGADDKVLSVAITTYLNTIYDEFDRQLTRTLTHLAEPPPAKEPEIVARLMGMLVESLTNLAVNLVGGGLVNLAATAGGANLGAAVRSAVQAVSKPAGQAVGVAFVKQSVPGSARCVAPETKQRLPEEPGGKSTLDEFGARQQRQLSSRKADANVIVALITSTPNLDHRRLTDLAVQLQSIEAESDDGSRFAQQVTIGWLNFCSAISLGEKKTVAEPDLLGANEPGGLASAGIKGVEQWRGGHDGFVDVSIAFPDQIHGLEGIKLASMRAQTSAGAIRILRTLESPFLGTPIYRRVWLGQGPSPLGWDPALVLSPDGSVNLDMDNPILAAVGRMQLTDIDQTRSIDDDDKEIVELEQRGDSLSTSIDRARLVSLRSKRASKRVERSRYAALGGSMLISWLARFSMEGLT